MIGSFRRSKGAALLRFEVRAQLREPLTTLYAMVFFLLAFGYATSGAVELVAERGAVPRTSGWALMLAFGGLTAFGQVITTMIAATAMLRDEAQGTRAMVATTGVSPRTWFLARVAAAIGLMLIVYAAMPAGILFGTWASSFRAPDGVDLTAALRGSLRAYAVITIPTMLIVTCVLATAAVCTQRVLGVLVAALALVAIWQGALALVAFDATRTLGALLDPFANTPVLALTHGWSDADKRVRAVPLATLLLVNRVCWLTLSAALVSFVLWRPAWVFAPAAAVTVPRTGRAARRVRRALARSRSVAASARHFTAGWITLDGGWRVVSLLALLNAVVNGLAVTRTVGAGSVEVLVAVSTHSRLFLILLATVYAGELVWRERDVRVDQVVNALGASRRALVLGRVLGVWQAQIAVVGPLVGIGLLLALTREGFAHPPGLLVLTWLTWGAFTLWLPFVQLTVLSLAVHVLLDHKVGAHLVLITGWVGAVVIDRQGGAPWWGRFADPAPLTEPASIADALGQFGLHAQRGAYWSAVSAALLYLCYVRWPSATTPPLTSRR